MKYLKVILAFIVIGIIAISLAWSQDKKNSKVQEGVMMLKSKGFSNHQRPPVRFDHFLHEEIIRCLMCHHDFYVYSDMNKGKGSKCASCHKEKLNKDNPVPLLMAFHKRCRGCHENYLKWGLKSGPVACGLCHK